MDDYKKCSDCGKIKEKFAPWFTLRKNVCYGHLKDVMEKFLEPVNKSEIQKDDMICIWHGGILRRVQISDLSSWIKERNCEGTIENTFSCPDCAATLKPTFIKHNI